MTRWSLSVDRERCIGSGLCVTYAPGAFSQDAEAKAVASPSAADGLDEVRAAVEACPTGAIHLTTDEGER